MITCKIDYDVLIEIEESGIDFKEHDYKHIKGQKRGHGPSRNLKVVAKSQMVLSGIVGLTMGNFMSLGIGYFHIHSILLIHGQNSNIEHYSQGIIKHSVYPFDGVTINVHWA